MNPDCCPKQEDTPTFAERAVEESKINKGVCEKLIESYVTKVFWDNFSACEIDEFKVDSMGLEASTGEFVVEGCQFYFCCVYPRGMSIKKIFAKKSESLISVNFKYKHTCGKCGNSNDSVEVVDMASLGDAIVCGCVYCNSKASMPKRM